MQDRAPEGQSPGHHNPASHPHLHSRGGETGAWAGPLISQGPTTGFGQGTWPLNLPYDCVFLEPRGKSCRKAILPSGGGHVIGTARAAVSAGDQADGGLQTVCKEHSHDLSRQETWSVGGRLGFHPSKGHGQRIREQGGEGSPVRR